MRFKELPKKEHDKLVRDYWKTWLAAFEFQVRDKVAFENFVTHMEQLIGQHYEMGGMEMDGVTNQDIE
jgi:hypothetical protein